MQTIIGVYAFFNVLAPSFFLIWIGLVVFRDLLEWARDPSIRMDWRRGILLTSGAVLFLTLWIYCNSKLFWLAIGE